MHFLCKAAIVFGIMLAAYLVADWSVGVYYYYRMREVPPSLAGIPGFEGEAYAVPEFGLEAPRNSSPSTRFRGRGCSGRGSTMGNSSTSGGPSTLRTSSQLFEIALKEHIFNCHIIGYSVDPNKRYTSLT